MTDRKRTTRKSQENTRENTCATKSSKGFGMRQYLIKKHRKNIRKRTAQTPIPRWGATPGVSGISINLKSIHDSLPDIRENMIKHSEMKYIITSILDEMKKYIQEENISDVKNSLFTEIKEKTTLEIKNILYISTSWIMSVRNSSTSAYYSFLNSE